MGIAYNFLLSNTAGPKIPHLLKLIKSERTGRFTWEYHQIQGKFVPQGQPPKASGEEVRYGMNQAVFDLYSRGSQFGTLTLKKALNTLVTGDTGDFVSFTFNTRDEARFTGKE